MGRGTIMKKILLTILLSYLSYLSISSLAYAMETTQTQLIAVQLEPLPNAALLANVLVNEWGQNKKEIITTDLAPDDADELINSTKPINAPLISGSQLSPLLKVLNEQAPSSRKRVTIKSTCEVCGKNVSRLEMHMRTHTKEKPYICSICNQSFSQSSHRNIHMRTHTKTYQCTKCNLSFPSFSEYSIHKRMHAGDKQFKCSFCDLSFVTPGQSEAHMLTHNPQNPYTCSECNQSFSSSNYRAEHMKTHTGEYKCQYCGQCFVKKLNHAKHESKLCILKPESIA